MRIKRPPGRHLRPEEYPGAWVSLMEIVCMSLSIFVPWWMKPTTLAKLWSNFFLLAEMFIKSPSYLFRPIKDFLRTQHHHPHNYPPPSPRTQPQQQKHTKAEDVWVDKIMKFLIKLLELFWYLLSTVFIFLVSTIPLLCACVPGFLFFNIFKPEEIIFLEKKTTTVVPSFPPPSSSESTTSTTPLSSSASSSTTSTTTSKKIVPTEFEHEAVGVLLYWCAADRVGFALSLILKVVEASLHRLWDVFHYYSGSSSNKSKEEEHNNNNNNKKKKKNKEK